MWSHNSGPLDRDSIMVGSSSDSSVSFDAFPFVMGESKRSAITSRSSGFSLRVRLHVLIARTSIILIQGRSSPSGQVVCLLLCSHMKDDYPQPCPIDNIWTGYQQLSCWFRSLNVLDIIVELTKIFHPPHLTTGQLSLSFKEL